MSFQFMFDRMLQSDSAFDGRFITGVLTTGIYCLPSCRARKPRAENVRFFDSEEDARSAGLRPCKKCRPDAWYAGHDPQWGRLREAWRMVQDRPGDFAGIDALAEVVGVGLSRLHGLTWQAWQQTPAEVLLQARLRWAARLLADRLPMIDVAFQCGFGSLSAFNSRFRQGFGMTPTEYRKLDAVATFTMGLPPRYDRSAVLRYLGRDADSLTERVIDGTYRMGLWIGDRPVEVVATLGAAAMEVTSAAPELHREVLGHVRRRLGLGVDPSRFEKAAAPLAATHPGLRVPLMSNAFETMVWIVLGQQVNVRYASTVRRRWVEAYGEPCGDGLFAPPRAERMAGLTVDDVARLGTTGRKAEVILGIARGFVEGQLPGEEGEPIPLLERRLLAWPGLGPWSVQYYLMRGLGVPDACPVGDAALHAAVQAWFGLEARPGAAEVTSCMARFAPWRSLATFHLWRWHEENKR
ncbi:MAG TPA: Ada metal-binding domain-containing protein [Candidatus Xenobia bacterium]|jgi:AraC family transcriptional regulator of adaptative response / DNA-3-methyladenine glycosylase II